MSKGGKVSRFNIDWLRREEFKDWLEPEDSDSTKARCKICRKTFSLSNMGEQAVKSHAEGKKHVNSTKLLARTTQSVEDFFKKPEVPEEATAMETARDISTGPAPSVLSKTVVRKEQQKAEILWALKSVMSHFSMNSAQDIVDVFKVMFPDSKIAQGMSCGPTKLSYLITFGLAPYFHHLLIDGLKKAPCFVVMFDESFNSELHQEQMDLCVRFFKGNQVVTRYLSSAFLGHTTATDLKVNFEVLTKDLDSKRMLQISMDGPSVNWKMLDMINEERKSAEQPGLLNVGSCSLHVVHGAFRNGATKTNWGVDSVLKALFRLFDESPAKREDYISITGSQVFPLPFCGHRWVEDKDVAERAIQIWPQVTKYITETLKKPRSQVPTSGTFSTVKSAVQDSLMLAKLEFFVSVAVVLKPYLQIFQSDCPLLPFITTELQTMLETLMGRFVKRQELESADTPWKLCQIKVLETSTHVVPSEINVGFAAAASLRKALKDKKVSQLQGLEFRKECAIMLAFIVSKIQEKSPLQYLLARKLSSLDPRLIVSNPEEAVKMFQNVLKELINDKWKTSQEADIELAQFRKMVFDAKKYHHTRFAAYNFNKERLDKFFFELLEGQEEYEKLWTTVKVLLTLSHGQASVERGFSVNKEALAPNLQEQSLKAIRLIHSHLTTEEIKVANFDITDELLSSCSHASNRYKMHLLEKKSEREETARGKKRKAKEEELTSAKKKRKELQVVIEKLTDTANKKAKEAEKQKDAAKMKALLMESNASREKCEQLHRKDIPDQDKQIQDLEKQLKDLK